MITKKRPLVGKILFLLFFFFYDCLVSSESLDTQNSTSTKESPIHLSVSVTPRNLSELNLPFSDSTNWNIIVKPLNLSGWPGVFHPTIREEVEERGNVTFPLLVYEKEGEQLNDRQLEAAGDPNNKKNRWVEDPDSGMPTVPFAFYGADSVDVKFQNGIKEAIREWTENTCLIFRPINAEDTVFLRFRRDKKCDSVFLRSRREQKCDKNLDILGISEFIIGNSIPKKPQDVFLAKECFHKPYISRILGKNLGLNYEHLRPERDDYISIRLKNVAEQYRGYFMRANPLHNDYWVQYDYMSVMQISAREHSTNGNLTIVTKDIQHQGLLGRSKGILSHMDKRFVNLKYGCISKWMMQCGLQDDLCLNDGYTGSDCKCVCKQGTYGDQCQNVKHDYYSEKIPSCSKVIDKETVIKTPNFPSRIQPDTWCTYQIKAPLHHCSKIKFLSFNLTKKDDLCSDAFLEIRLEGPLSGSVYCGDSIKPGQEFLSKDGNIDLYLDVKDNQSPGFEAEVSFELSSSHSIHFEGHCLVLVLLMLLQNFLFV